MCEDDGGGCILPSSFMECSPLNFYGQTVYTGEVVDKFKSAFCIIYGRTSVREACNKRDDSSSSSSSPSLINTYNGAFCLGFCVHTLCVSPVMKNPRKFGW